MRKRHPSSIRVGTAGWDYDDWKGVVYPRPRPRGFDPLRYLAGYIDLIEINSTFYRPPTAEVAKRWVDRVADVADFRFTAKLWRRFTHQRQEAWSVSDVEEARRGLDVLLDSGRLDAVLVQFPWSFRNDETNRGWLDDVSSTFPDYPLVVEVRHESWNVPGFHAWLVDSGIGFVNVDQPLFRSSIRPSAYVTAAAAYIRARPQLLGLVPQGRGAGRAIRLPLRARRAEAVGQPSEGRRGTCSELERRRRLQQPLPRPGRGQRAAVPQPAGWPAAGRTRTAGGRVSGARLM
jgi:uncharacterized protein YecE (DUF72 family)